MSFPPLILVSFFCSTQKLFAAKIVRRLARSAASSTQRTPTTRFREPAREPTSLKLMSEPSVHLTAELQLASAWDGLAASPLQPHPDERSSQWQHGGLQVLNNLLNYSVSPGDCATQGRLTAAAALNQRSGLGAASSHASSHAYTGYPPGDGNQGASSECSSTREVGAPRIEVGGVHRFCWPSVVLLVVAILQASPRALRVIPL